MSEKKFSKKHEWVSLDGDTATVGITKHATEMLGDIVFVEVPEPGKSVEKDGQAAVVESTKAASDVYSPISGEILEGNKLIVDVSKGITPSQVKYFSFYRRGANHSFSLIYEDSNGEISQAGIGTISYKEANALYKAFMNWFNSK